MIGRLYVFWMLLLVWSIVSESQEDSWCDVMILFDVAPPNLEDNITNNGWYEPKKKSIKFPGHISS